jgi:hypothetical protein
MAGGIGAQPAGYEKYLAQAAVGVISGVSQGASPKKAFISAGVGAVSGSMGAHNLLGKTTTGRGIMNAAIAGTASELSGGNFTNGAASSAFGSLFRTVGQTKEFAMTIKILAVDIQALITGQIVGTIWTLYDDAINIGHNISQLNIRGSGIALLKTIQNLIVPKYGYYGGSGWGRRQFGDSDRTKPLNNVDIANFKHDDHFDHHKWLRDVYFGNIKGIPAGPFGQIYKVLGTIPFGIAGAFQQ